MRTILMMFIFLVALPAYAGDRPWIVSCGECSHQCNLVGSNEEKRVSALALCSNNNRICVPFCYLEDDESDELLLSIVQFVGEIKQRKAESILQFEFKYNKGRDYGYFHTDAAICWMTSGKKPRKMCE